jgi:hypothetical protein
MRVSLEVAHTALLPGGVFNQSAVHRSLDLGRTLRSLLEAAGHEVSHTLLVDDKQLSKEERNDVTEDFVALVDREFEVDVVAAEHRLSRYLDDLLDLLPPNGVRRRVSKQLHERLRDTGALPCAADIALWHSLRLGLIPDRDGVLTAHRAHFEPADAVVSVLIEHDREPEEIAVNRYLKYVEGAGSRIHRVFYPETADQPLDGVDLASVAHEIAQGVHAA